MRLTFDTSSAESYRDFLSLKACPSYRWDGREAVVPDEYAARFGKTSQAPAGLNYCPPDWMFDYQAELASTVNRKRKFAVFADCGLGKTLILLEAARHAHNATGGRVLIVSPLMVIGQTMDEERAFYSAPMLQRLSAAELPIWLESGKGIGITNYEAIRDNTPTTGLSGLLLDESSMLKSHYGKWGTRLIEMGRGVPFKSCYTGTPAPNDRIEFANHAVFLDHARTVNEFLATYFVNRGETSNRWELKPHALRPFYRSLSHWCCFLSDPAVYGFKDNCETLPPIHVHTHEVELTSAQRKLLQKETGGLFVTQAGGIGSRSVLSQLAKGSYRGEAVESNKPAFIADMIATWSGVESTLVWCRYNAEQALVSDAVSPCYSIDGTTPVEQREEMIRGFKGRESRTMVSKPKVLGFGLNLQVATRQVFSGLQDSYEEYYQAVKRSNRIGSTRPLHVHIPATEIEWPMIETVMAKATRVEQDTREQEQLFMEASRA